MPVPRHLRHRRLRPLSAGPRARPGLRALGRAAATTALLMTVTAAHAQPAGAAAAAGSGDAIYKPILGQPGKDVIWVPTAQALVDRMLEMARITPRDRLVDLGAGDGRMVITAARRGIPALGIEYNPKLVQLARRSAAAAGLTDLASFREGDILKTDFSSATVVTLFLLPDLNLELRPTLLAMKPGTRVVSNSFTMGDWAADESAQVPGCSGYCSAYLWIVPAQVAGRWKVGDRELVLTQTFQEVSGRLEQGAKATQLSEVDLRGPDLRFRVGDEIFSGRVLGDEIWGTINGAGTWRARRTGR